MGDTLNMDSVENELKKIKDNLLALRVTIDLNGNVVSEAVLDEMQDSAQNLMNFLKQWRPMLVKSLVEMPNVSGKDLRTISEDLDRAEDITASLNSYVVNIESLLMDLKGNNTFAAITNPSDILLDLHTILNQVLQLVCKNDVETSDDNNTGICSDVKKLWKARQEDRKSFWEDGMAEKFLSMEEEVDTFIAKLNNIGSIDVVSIICEQCTLAGELKKILEYHHELLKTLSNTTNRHELEIFFNDIDRIVHLQIEVDCHLSLTEAILTSDIYNIDPDFLDIKSIEQVTGLLCDLQQHFNNTKMLVKGYSVLSSPSLGVKYKKGTASPSESNADSGFVSAATTAEVALKRNNRKLEIDKTTPTESVTKDTAVGFLSQSQTQIAHHSPEQIASTSHDGNARANNSQIKKPGPLDLKKMEDTLASLLQKLNVGGHGVAPIVLTEHLDVVEELKAGLLQWGLELAASVEPGRRSTEIHRTIRNIQEITDSLEFHFTVTEVAQHNILLSSDDNSRVNSATLVIERLENLINEARAAIQMATPKRKKRLSSKTPDHKSLQKQVTPAKKVCKGKHTPQTKVKLETASEAKAQQQDVATSLDQSGTGTLETQQKNLTQNSANVEQTQNENPTSSNPRDNLQNPVPSSLEIPNVQNYSSKVQEFRNKLASFYGRLNLHESAVTNMVLYEQCDLVNEMKESLLSYEKELLDQLHSIPENKQAEIYMKLSKIELMKDEMDNHTTAVEITMMDINDLSVNDDIILPTVSSLLECVAVFIGDMMTLTSLEEYKKSAKETLPDNLVSKAAISGSVPIQEKVTTTAVENAGSETSTPVKPSSPNNKLSVMEWVVQDELHCLKKILSSYALKLEHQGYSAVPTVLSQHHILSRNLKTYLASYEAMLNTTLAKSLSSFSDGYFTRYQDKISHRIEIVQEIMTRLLAHMDSAQTIESDFNGLLDEEEIPLCISTIRALLQELENFVNQAHAIFTEKLPEEEKLIQKKPDSKQNQVGFSNSGVPTLEPTPGTSQKYDDNGNKAMSTSRNTSFHSTANVTNISSDSTKTGGGMTNISSDSTRTGGGMMNISSDSVAGTSQGIVRPLEQIDTMMECRTFQDKLEKLCTTLKENGFHSKAVVLLDLSDLSNIFRDTMVQWQRTRSDRVASVHLEIQKLLANVDCYREMIQFTICDLGGNIQNHSAVLSRVSELLDRFKLFIQTALNILSHDCKKQRVEMPVLPVLPVLPEVPVLPAVFEQSLNVTVTTADNMNEDNENYESDDDLDSSFLSNLSGDSDIELEEASQLPRLPGSPNSRLGRMNSWINSTRCLSTWQRRMRNQGLKKIDELMSKQKQSDS